MDDYRGGVNRGRLATSGRRGTVCQIFRDSNCSVDSTWSSLEEVCSRTVKLWEIGAGASTKLFIPTKRGFCSFSRFIPFNPFKHSIPYSQFGY